MWQLILKSVKFLTFSVVGCHVKFQTHKNVLPQMFYDQINSTLEFRNVKRELYFTRTRRWIMHQSIPAAPSPPPGLLRGIFPPCQSRGWGICQFYPARGPGICQPRGQHRTFDTHSVSYQQYNYTEDFTGWEKQADWIMCQGQEKIEEVCKGMFSILYMHFFIASQARTT